MTRLDRQYRIIAISLAALAGMIDAIGFLASGGFFISFMSGNSTRLSVGIVEGADYLLTAAFLLLSFVGGVTAGSLAGRIVFLTIHQRQAAILICIAILLFAVPILEGQDFMLLALCVAAFCMGAENTIFERDGTTPFGLTYMTGALVKVGQGLAGMMSGGKRWDWVPYLILWLGLVGGAVIGSALYTQVGIISFGLPAIIAAIFGVGLLYLGKKTAS